MLTAFYCLYYFLFYHLKCLPQALLTYAISLAQRNFAIFSCFTFYTGMLWKLKNRLCRCIKKWQKIFRWIQKEKTVQVKTKYKISNTYTKLFFFSINYWFDYRDRTTEQRFSLWTVPEVTIMTRKCCCLKNPDKIFSV